MYSFYQSRYHGLYSEGCKKLFLIFEIKQKSDRVKNNHDNSVVFYWHIYIKNCVSMNNE